jgi:hypothetical protein
MFCRRRRRAFMLPSAGSTWTWRSRAATRACAARRGWGRGEGRAERGVKGGGGKREREAGEQAGSAAPPPVPKPASTGCPAAAAHLQAPAPRQRWAVQGQARVGKVVAAGGAALERRLLLGRRGTAGRVQAACLVAQHGGAAGAAQASRRQASGRGRPTSRRGAASVNERASTSKLAKPGGEAPRRLLVPDWGARLHFCTTTLLALPWGLGQLR